MKNLVSAITFLTLVVLVCSSPLLYYEKSTVVVNKVDFSDSGIDHRRLSNLLDDDAPEEHTTAVALGDALENEIAETDARIKAKDNEPLRESDAEAPEIKKSSTGDVIKIDEQVKTNDNSVSADDGKNITTTESSSVTEATENTTIELFTTHESIARSVESTCLITGGTTISTTTPFEDALNTKGIIGPMSSTIMNTTTTTSTLLKTPTTAEVLTSTVSSTATTTDEVTITDVPTINAGKTTNVIDITTTEETTYAGSYRSSDTVYTTTFAVERSSTPNTDMKISEVVITDTTTITSLETTTVNRYTISNEITTTETITRTDNVANTTIDTEVTTTGNTFTDESPVTTEATNIPPYTNNPKDTTDNEVMNTKSALVSVSETSTEIIEHLTELGLTGVERITTASPKALGITNSEEMVTTNSDAKITTTATIEQLATVEPTITEIITTIATGATPSDSSYKETTIGEEIANTISYTATTINEVTVTEAATINVETATNARNDMTTEEAIYAGSSSSFEIRYINDFDVESFSTPSIVMEASVVVSTDAITVSSLETITISRTKTTTDIATSTTIETDGTKTTGKYASDESPAIAEVSKRIRFNLADTADSEITMTTTQASTSTSETSTEIAEYLRVIESTDIERIATATPTSNGVTNGEEMVTIITDANVPTNSVLTEILPTYDQTTGTEASTITSASPETMAAIGVSSTTERTSVANSETSTDSEVIGDKTITTTEPQTVTASEESTTADPKTHQTSEISFIFDESPAINKVRPTYPTDPKDTTTSVESSTTESTTTAALEALTDSEIFGRPVDARNRVAGSETTVIEYSSAVITKGTTTPSITSTTDATRLSKAITTTVNARLVDTVANEVITTTGSTSTADSELVTGSGLPQHATNIHVTKLNVESTTTQLVTTIADAEVITDSERFTTTDRLTTDESSTITETGTINNLLEDTTTTGVNTTTEITSPAYSETRINSGSIAELNTTTVAPEITTSVVDTITTERISTVIDAEATIIDSFTSTEIFTTHDNFATIEASTTTSGSTSLEYTTALGVSTITEYTSTAASEASIHAEPTESTGNDMLTVLVSNPVMSNYVTTTSEVSSSTRDIDIIPSTGSSTTTVILAIIEANTTTSGRIVFENTIPRDISSALVSETSKDSAQISSSSNETTIHVNSSSTNTPTTTAFGVNPEHTSITWVTPSTTNFATAATTIATRTVAQTTTPDRTTLVRTTTTAGMTAELSNVTPTTPASGSAKSSSLVCFLASVVLVMFRIAH
ncbi:uncharacterized protein LOC131695304 [Topomyia yanbarensis]|uniref:uncharacterized protein LOC131695304 n=1 Tax=Topomyia yanbarensis TaxID=2498891 RepID=UPI00273AD0CC|nr:uncharacterized protein LOC131695304 [Topomyia yanbarensis]